jgi:hypothetical protein
MITDRGARRAGADDLGGVPIGGRKSKTGTSRSGRLDAGHDLTLNRCSGLGIGCGRPLAWPESCPPLELLGVQTIDYCLDDAEDDAVQCCRQ